MVARFREDLGWLAELDLPATVYDKSGELETAPGPRTAVAPLPNLGRESHTYLHHILTRWPDFPAYTAFLQGDPFAHAAPGSTPAELRATLLELIRRRVRFKGLAGYAIRCDPLGRPHHLREERHRGHWAGWGRDIPVGAVYAALFTGPVPESFHCRAPAGLLLVSRETILARPRGLYLRAMELIQADPHDAHNTGHALERLWYLIFNGYAALNRDDYPDAAYAGPMPGTPHSPDTPDAGPLHDPTVTRPTEST